MNTQNSTNAQPAGQSPELRSTDWLAELPPQPLLGTYLAAHVKAGVIDFALRASLAPDGAVTFCIHPANVSGRTEDFHAQVNRPEVYNVRGLDALIAACFANASGEPMPAASKSISQ